MDARSKVDILVVDDNPNQLTALGVILEALGENVVTTSSGKEALKCLLGRDFAVILLDVNMPIMDGFETAALIRQRARSEHTPIIFITGFGDETHMSRGYSLGAVDYILTPVVPEVLRTKVAVFVELFRKSDEVKRQSEILRRRAAQLHELTEASLAINAATSIDGMLAIVTERARKIVSAQGAAMTVMVGAGRSHDAVSIAPESALSAPDVHGIVETIGMRVAERQALVRIAAPDPASAAEAPGGAVGLPVSGRDGPGLGMLCVAGKLQGDFNDEDETILVQLAQIASIAIQNILYSEEREANRLKDEFLATVSHELRTPLNAMLTWARVLQQGKLDAASSARGLEVIARNAKAQAQLIDDLLDVSRIMTGKLRLEIATLDLNAIIDGTIESVRPAAQAKGIELRAPTVNVGRPIQGDAKRLQQVMGNLLANAIKFTPKDGKIRVGVSMTDGQVEVRVSDTGPGISPAFLPHVFDRFRQADTSSTRAHGGLGLGLAIVRHLIEQHDGSVSAESPGEDGGATFRVRLPIMPALDGAVPAALAAASNDGSVGTTAASRASALDGLRVLLVEDDRDSREAIAVLLTNAGARVSAVPSAHAALEAIARWRPDVLVSDIGLPEQDGYALIKNLRTLDAARGGDTPAIALTAYTRAQDRARALAAGYQSHVGKPVDPTELVRVLVRFAPLRRATATAG
jgi:signal transduction histidine kinase/ActR/RegA family two-component response regulator